MMTTLTSEDKTVIVRIGNERKLSRKEQNEQKVLYRLIETIFFPWPKVRNEMQIHVGRFHLDTYIIIL